MGALAALAAGQSFTARGFLENSTTFYPQRAANDRAHIVSEALFRYEASWRPNRWLQLNGAFDARTDTHRQAAREWRLDADDRSVERPAFSLRRFSVMVNRGSVTAEAGRQLIRWGKTDIINPLDRFAPKDYLNPVNTDILGVSAVRLTYEKQANTFDLVWQPWFTPARTPLLNQRWTVLPSSAAAIPVQDLGARYPGRSQLGLRWNRLGQGYEYSLAYFDGFNYLPLFAARPSTTPPAIAFERYYPRLRLVGASGAFPTRQVTVKGEAGYFTTSRSQTDEYLLYVLQLERQQGEWSFAGGYAGEIITHAAPNALQFSPERGLARSFLGRAGYTIGPTRSIAFEGVARQNGKGVWLRFTYTETYGQHWRFTGGVTLMRGETADFLGQYRRNSYASLALRYSL
jgi:hypothetical protein